MKKALTVATIATAAALTFALPLVQGAAPALGSSTAFARGGHHDARGDSHGGNRGGQGADDGAGHDANDDHGGQRNGHR